MQITFERTGGFAGMIVTTTINTDTLPADETRQLHSLIQASDFFRLPAEITAAPQPDRFQYHITIQDGAKSHAVVVGETVMPGTLRPLVDWLMDAARHKRS